MADEKIKPKPMKKYTAPVEEPNPKAKFFQLASWIVIVVVLGIVLYMIFVGSDPRREFKTVEETVSAYTAFARNYGGVTGTLPDPSVVGDYLEFFDSKSRRYFEKNYPYMAEARLDTRAEEFSQLGDAGKRGHAMLLLVNTPPLSGIARIVAKRNTEDGKVELDVSAGRGDEVRIYMVQADGLWYFEDLMGVQPQLDRRIEPFRAKDRAKKK